jgi:hypothetical protein
MTELRIRLTIEQQDGENQYGTARWETQGLLDVTVDAVDAWAVYREVVEALTLPRVGIEIAEAKP